MENTYSLPDDLLAFITKHGNEEIALSGSNLEVETIKFYGPHELNEDYTLLDTWEYHNNYGEFVQDPELMYKIQSVDLIKEDCDDNYSSDGLLVWFPLMKCFGTSDTDHQLIYVFPETPWNIIRGSLGNFINTQWYPESTKNQLLMPWKEQGFNISFDHLITHED